MASLISNQRQVTDSASDRARRKRKKKSSPSPSLSLAEQVDGEGHKRWRSERQQQIYSTKLAQALRKLRISQPASSPSTSRRGRAVREAADRALAVAARGRTLWSRAILTSRSVKLKYRKQKRPRLAPSPATALTGSSRSRKPKVSLLSLKEKRSTAVQRKVKELRRLVPGCRKQPLPVMLEEAIDYIVAKEMQIRAMSDLAELLTRGASSAPRPSSG